MYYSLLHRLFAARWHRHPEFSGVNHDHDTDYADITHNHDTDYADITHNHDTDYADITHSHGGTGVQSSISLILTNSVSVNPSSVYPVAWDEAEWQDEGVLWDGEGESIITISQTGLYHLLVSLLTEPVTGLTRLRVYLGNDVLIERDITPFISRICKLTENDELVIQWYHQHSAARSILSSSYVQLYLLRLEEGEENPWLDTLISHYKMDDANDSYGANHLTNNNVNFVAGKIGNAGDFENTSSAYLSISDGAQVGLDLTSDFTISLWIKPESLASGNDVLLAKYLASGNQRSYMIRLDTSGKDVEVFLSYNGSSSTKAETPTNSVVAGQWLHVVVVYNSTDIRIYLDGALASNGASNPAAHTTGVFNGTGDFRIGVQQGSSDYFDGLIDELSIWGRALSAGEVSELYNSGDGLDILA